MKTYRLGTRGSALAVAQSSMIADQLRALGFTIDLVTVRTEGDQTSGSLRDSGVGVFAAALRAALLAGQVDFAVHSFKDLPTAEVPGLVVAGVPDRANPADVLCTRPGTSWATLPLGASVGTGSPRRLAQLAHVRPDLDFVDIRGNVGTRLARLERDLDTVVLAAAGLDRLGLDVGTPLPFDVVVPAPAQGALALECRSDDSDVIAMLAKLDDPATRLAVTAERAVLARLAAGCSAPLGALATWCADELQLHVRFAGHPRLEVTVSRPVATMAAAAALGREAAEALLANGLPDSIQDNRVRRLDLPLSGQHLLLPASVSDRLIEALRDAGADVTCVPLTETRYLDATVETSGWDWVVITSTATLAGLERLGRPLPSLVGPNTKVAAVGPATSAAITALGLPVALVPAEGNGQALAAEFPIGVGRVLLPGSALMNERLDENLAAKGWQVSRVPVYTTEALANVETDLRERFQTGAFTTLILTAGSNVRAAATLLGRSQTPVVTLGKPSAAVARAAGFNVRAVAATPDAPGLIAALTADHPAR